MLNAKQRRLIIGSLRSQKAHNFHQFMTLHDSRVFKARIRAHG